jgi:hypothetical protein
MLNELQEVLSKVNLNVGSFLELESGSRREVFNQDNV